MKSRVKSYWVLIVVLLGFGFQSKKNFPRDDTPNLKQSLHHPVPDSILNLLRQDIGSNRIIGIGEPVHWNFSIYNAQNAIARFLVDSFDVNRIFIEKSYFTVRNFQYKYINAHNWNNINNSDPNAVRRRMSAVINRQMVDLVNLGVEVYGINIGSLYDNYQHFIGCLDTVNEELAGKLRSIVKIDSTDEEIYFWYYMTLDELNEIKRKLNLLNEDIRKLFGFPYPEGCKFLIKDLEYVYLKREHGDVVRDSLIFDILKEYLDPFHRNLILAHNGHLINDRQVRPDNLGQRIKKGFQRNSFLLGMEFKTGSYFTQTWDPQISNSVWTIRSFNGQYRLRLWRKNRIKAITYCPSLCFKRNSYRTKWVGAVDFDRNYIVADLRNGFDGVLLFPSITAD